MSAPPAIAPRAAAEPAPAPPVAAAATAPSRERYAIQVAAYTREANAQREVSALVDRGYEPYILRARGADGRPILRVVFGNYESYTAAVRVAARFTAEERRETMVRPVWES